MDEMTTTHPCNYKDEGGCSVCGLTEELFEKLKGITMVEPPKEIKWNDTIR